MAYDKGTAILGTREEALQSLFLDCSAITLANGFSQDVKVIIRQFQGFAEIDSPGLIIDTGSDSAPEWLLQNLCRRTMTVSIIGFCYSAATDLATKVEAWMEDVRKAIVANPYRSISGTPKAWTSEIKSEGTMFSGTLGRFMLQVDMVLYGVQ